MFFGSSDPRIEKANEGFSLAIPKRFAAFLFSLFSSNSDVLELSIIHRQQLSPLAISLTAYSKGSCEGMENLPKGN